MMDGGEGAGVDRTMNFARVKINEVNKLLNLYLSGDIPRYIAWIISP